MPRGASEGLPDADIEGDRIVRHGAGLSGMAMSARIGPKLV